jgi:hypothetical protein
MAWSNPVQNFRRSQELCPDLPWTNDDPDKLGPVVMAFVKEQEVYHRRWCQRWFENMQFIFGNSNLRWSRRYDFAVDADFLRPGVSFAQRASTNIARVVAEALASLIYSNIPTWEGQRANESAQKGRRFSRIVENLMSYQADALSADEVLQSASMMYVCYSQLAFKSDWSQSAGQLIDLPLWKKVKAPVMTDYLSSDGLTGGQITVPTPQLSSMGVPYFEDRWEAVTDENGRQKVQTMLTGGPILKALTPLEYRRDPSSSGMHDTKFVQEIRIIDFDDYLREYGQMDGKTKHFDSVSPDLASGSIYSFAIQHLMRMRTTTAPSAGDGSMRTSGGTSVGRGMMKNKVLVVEHYDRPDAEMWPRGRRLIITNGECTHITEPSYFIPKAGGWHPYSEAQWLRVPPSSIASGPMDSVTSKNRELNTADSLVATAMRRNLGSVMLYKHGSGFDPNKFTGEPGQTQGVADIDGVKWLHDSQPIPPVINELRQSNKDDIYESSGAGDALRGDRSAGASSGYMLRQLEEREKKRLTPARKNFERAVSLAGEKLLQAIRTNCVKLDDQTMAYMKRSAAGEFTTEDVIAFISGPLTSGIEVKVRPSSMVMKSAATMQANLMELVNGPAAARVAQDPAVLDEVLKVFGVDTLNDSNTPHRDRATRENDVFADMNRLGPNTEGGKVPNVLAEDNDEIHVAEHDKFIIRNSDELLQNEWLFQMVLLHKELHVLQSQEKQGSIPLGSKLQAPAMMAQARQKPAPMAQDIYNGTMQMTQARLQTQQAQQTQQDQRDPNQSAGKTPTGKRVEKEIQNAAQQ